MMWTLLSTRLRKYSATLRDEAAGNRLLGDLFMCLFPTPYDPIAPALHPLHTCFGKLQQHVVWRGGLPHILIQQDELGQLGAPEGTVRTDGFLCQPCRGWQHIGIEGRRLNGPAAGPKPTAALFCARRLRGSRRRRRGAGARRPEKRVTARSQALQRNGPDYISRESVPGTPARPDRPALRYARNAGRRPHHRRHGCNRRRRNRMLHLIRDGADDHLDAERARKRAMSSW